MTDVRVTAFANAVVRMIALAALLLVADLCRAVNCPPRRNDGAVKVRDLDGDGRKDYRYDAETGRHRRTKTDEHGSRIEMWCLNKGGASQFVWMYIPGKGKPQHGNNLYVGHCKYDGGKNTTKVKKKKIDGKKKFKTLYWTNRDRRNADSTERARGYRYDTEAGTIRQRLVKDNGDVVDEVTDKKPPHEDGRGIGLPMAPQGARARDSGGSGSVILAPDDQDDEDECPTGAVGQGHLSADTPQPLPDLGAAASTIVVAESVVTVVRQVIVDLEIQHGRVGDLIVTLEHDGRTATLINRVGQEGGEGLGCEADGLDVDIDDCADEVIHGACASPIIEGSWRPDEYAFPPGPSPLSVFDETSPLGEWTLHVTDNAAGETGSVEHWELHYAGDGDVGPGTEQPTVARAQQEVGFPLLIDVVECLGIIAAPPSNLFWWEVEDDVGPVEVGEIEPGSPAAAAGLEPGDVVIEMLNIPHNMAPEQLLQNLDVVGGTVELGFNIERNRKLGFAIIDLRVQRGNQASDVTLDIGAVNPCACPGNLDGDGEVGVTDFLAMLAAWGPNPGHPADLDGDGEVGVTDFLQLLALWGPCP